VKVAHSPRVDGKGIQYADLTNAAVRENLKKALNPQKCKSFLNEVKIMLMEHFDELIKLRKEGCEMIANDIDLLKYTATALKMSPEQFLMEKMRENSQISEFKEELKSFLSEIE
jgi:hypothetical protein